MCFVFVEKRRRCGRDPGRVGTVAEGDAQVALSATPAALCFVFVEARRGCGWDASGARAAAGGHPREARAAQGGGGEAGRRHVTQRDHLVTDHSSRAAGFTCKYRIYVTDNRDKRVSILEI